MCCVCVAFCFREGKFKWEMKYSCFAFGFFFIYHLIYLSNKISFKQFKDPFLSPCLSFVLLFIYFICLRFFLWIAKCVYLKIVSPSSHTLSVCRLICRFRCLFRISTVFRSFVHLFVCSFYIFVGHSYGKNVCVRLANKKCRYFYFNFIFPILS